MDFQMKGSLFFIFATSVFFCFGCAFLFWQGLNEYQPQYHLFQASGSVYKIHKPSGTTWKEIKGEWLLITTSQ